MGQLSVKVSASAKMCMFVLVSVCLLWVFIGTGVFDSGEDWLTVKCSAGRSVLHNRNACVFVLGPWTSHTYICQITTWKKAT